MKGPTLPRQEQYRREPPHNGTRWGRPLAAADPIADGSRPPLAFPVESIPVRPGFPSDVGPGSVCHAEHQDQSVKEASSLFTQLPRSGHRAESGLSVAHELRSPRWTKRVQFLFSICHPHGNRTNPSLSGFRGRGCRGRSLPRRFLQIAVILVIRGEDQDGILVLTLPVGFQGPR
jgi:hypothetical protein